MMKGSKGLLTFWGILLIVVAVLYALLGSLILIGQKETIIPDYNGQVTLIVIVAYAVALLALLGGIGCIFKNVLVAKIAGIIFAIWGLYSLISAQLVGEPFNIFVCLEMLLGVAIFATAITIKEDKSSKKNI